MIRRDVFYRARIAATAATLEVRRQDALALVALAEALALTAAQCLDEIERDAEALWKEIEASP